MPFSSWNAKDSNLIVPIRIDLGILGVISSRKNMFASMVDGQSASYSKLVIVFIDTFLTFPHYLDNSTLCRPPVGILVHRNRIVFLFFFSECIMMWEYAIQEKIVRLLGFPGRLIFPADKMVLFDSKNKRTEKMSSDRTFILPRATHFTRKLRAPFSNLSK